MGGAPIKLVVIDVDGTLLNSRSEVSQANAEAIAECTAKGIKVCLATAKSVIPISKLIRRLGIIGPQILLNGAMLINERLEALHLRPLGRDLYRRALHLVRSYGGSVAATRQDGVFCYEKEVPEYRFFVETGEIVKQVDDLDLPEFWDSCLQLTLPIEASDELEDILRSELFREARITRGGRYFLNINNAGASKRRALQEVLEVYGFRREEIMAMGDSENDAEMIEFAGLGVAMANGSSKLKELADYVTLSNDEDGVAFAIRELLLSDIS